MKVLCTQYVDVRAPAEQVFAYVADLSRWPMWFGCVVSAQQAEERPLDLDEEVRLCLHAGRRRWQESFEVTRFMRNAFLSIEGLLSAARRIDFRFERRGQLTRLSCAIGYPVFGGLLAVAADALFHRPQIRRELRDSLVHLKNMLEETVNSASWADEEQTWQPARPAAGGRQLASQGLRVV